MQIFACPSCRDRVYFHNTGCRCGHQVCFDPDAGAMRTGQTPCSNRGDIGCNWVAEAGGLCRSCAMTETVPDVGTPENIGLWTRTEAAKRWMLSNLMRWGWFTSRDTGVRPVFRLLSEQTASGGADVIMGHADGVITINVTEASEATRKDRQEKLGELYRTMLGHMRHEVAHFLYLRLSDESGFRQAFRALFGDETVNYGAALDRHYRSPQPAGPNYVTSYASAHPHEDWAETTAHLLHLTDLLDSAAATGLLLPGGPSQGVDAYSETDTERLVTQAVDTAIAINHVNRALDLPDLYPFVLRSGVREKLAFVHRHLRLRR